MYRTEFEPKVFLKAQARTYDSALQELSVGKKEGHWMWFIFPQLRGLGKSVYADLYGLRDVQEAKLYLEDQTLGSRLRECVAILVRRGHLTSGDIFPWPDDLKLHACLTLFDRASPEDVFETALIQFFGGVRHLQTMNAIAGLEKSADSILHRMLHCISSLARPRL